MIFGENFWMGVLASFVASKIDMLAKYIRNNFNMNLTFLHSNELLSKINEMPFIYKELDSDIMNDFVDVKIETIDLTTYKLSPKKSIDLSTHEKMKIKKRGIFLGNAGIGKTTFLRHTIIELLKHLKDAPFFYKDENLVPFYVPLKAVYNIQRYPILKYLLSNNKMLSHSNGMKILLKLVESRRLFLVLDGYDEISNMSDNFIRDELDMIIGRSFGEQEFYDEDIYNFYCKLVDCRVWLSSRILYYNQFPLKIADATDNILALELRGIGNNRAILINNIFKKYYKKTPRSRELLNYEYFLTNIETADELLAISFNPLLLTVMCYVYAREAIDTGCYNIDLKIGVDDLLTECIKLLLHDLDADKIRGLSDIDKKTMMRRRNDYLEEKEAFLPFFATELFFEDKNHFDYDYLKSKAIEFFQTKYNKNSQSDIILRNLIKQNSINPNFANQLISSGVFIFVDSINDKFNYDFPHRRFREVLAVKFLNSLEGFNILSTYLDKKHLSEFLYVYFEKSDYKDELLYSLLNICREITEDHYYANIIINCFRNNSQNYSPNKTLEKYFDECIDAKAFFRLPVEILSFYEPTPSFLTKIKKYIKEQWIGNDNLVPLSLCCYLMTRFNKQLSQELLESKLMFFSDDDQYKAVLLQWILSVAPNILISNTPNFTKTHHDFLDFCYVISKNIDKYFSENILESLLSILSGHQKLVFYFFIIKFAKKERVVYPVIKKQQDVNDFYIVKNIIENSQHLSRDFKNLQNIYFITDEIAQKLSFMPETFRYGNDKFIAFINTVKYTLYDSVEFIPNEMELNLKNQILEKSSIPTEHFIAIRDTVKNIEYTKLPLVDLFYPQ